MQKIPRRRARRGDDRRPLAPTVDDSGSETSAAVDSVATHHDAPALTRRELREREARQRTSRPVRAGSPSSTAASTATPTPRGRRAATRSARLTRATRRGSKPRVAASVTATATAPSAARVVSLKRRVLSNVVSVAAMAGVGLILVATTVPANAFSRPGLPAESVVNEVTVSEDSQELTVESVAGPTVVRDGYTVISQKQQLAAKYGDRLMLFTNNPNGTVQWPFPTGAPITSGFGSRQVAGCGFCSTYHEGLDFTPGAGTPIQSIADGIVSKVQLGGAYGNHVEIEHLINGQLVTTTYSHMQYGSIEVAEGQTVAVGDIVGAVGSTGASTGPHLHLEVHLDGTPVDPFAWLQANAN